LKNHSSELALVEHNRGITFKSLSEIEDTKYNIIKSIGILETALDQQKDCEIRHAETQRDLALAYIAFSEISTDEEIAGKNLQIAIAMLNESLDTWKKNNCPIEYAKTMNSLGIASYDQAKLKKDYIQLIKSLSYFDEALKTLDKQNYPLDYAEIMRNRGVAYRELEILGIKPNMNLNKAIISYNEAIDIWERNQCPYDAAETRILLGNAYRELAIVDAENRIINKQNAIDSFIVHCKT